MGKKFYSETETGGTIFHTERRIGDVRIPNYVYDIWLPLLGAQALGVYAVYCRLERQGTVKAMTQARLARICRMGTGKLSSINEQLEDCGFVRIKKPEGQARLMHWTTEITILDAPHEVSKTMKDKYAIPAGYETLTPWLEAESPENLDGFSAEPETAPPETPEEDPNIAALGILQPLEVVKTQEKSKPDILDAMLHYGNREQPENWAVPAAAGGADDWGAAVDAFAGLLSLEPATLPGTTRREWSRVLQKVGNRWKTGPSTVAHVIEQIPESQFHWKTYAGPHSAEQDIGVLIGQFQGGGIQKPKKTSGGNGENRHDRNKRIIERARAKYLLPEDTIDAESITIL